jgi:hypothetical protein
MAFMDKRGWLTVAPSLLLDDVHRRQVLRALFIFESAIASPPPKYFGFWHENFTP